MGPVAQADGHDVPRLIDELVPGVAAMIEQVVVGLEDPVRQPVVAHELPDVLDRVQLRADGSEDVGRGGALVVRRAGARSAPGPAAGDLVLLADARLVGEPDLYPGQGNAFVSRNRVEQGREFFLNSSMSSMRCA